MYTGSETDARSSCTYMRTKGFFKNPLCVRGGRDVRGGIVGRLGAKNARLLLEFDTLAVGVARSSIYQWKALKEKHLLSTKNIPTQKINV